MRCYVVLSLVFCVACTKHNPASCCTTPEQCTSYGLDGVTGCESGDVCDMTGTCVAPQCSTASDCTSGDACIGQLCVPASAIPVCGNGIIEAGEVCDDGNTMDGDGCNSTCTVANCFVPVTHPTIAAAIADGSCSVVDVYSGTYDENLSIAKGVELQGVGANPSIIDGKGSASVVTITSGVVVLSALTIQNGRAAQGGGIHNDSSLTLENVVVQGNTAETLFGEGGGVYNDGPNLTLQQSTITGNHAVTDGSSGSGAGAAGAGVFSASGVVTITGGSIAANDITILNVPGVSTRGAGIDSEDGHLEVMGTAISSNKIMVMGDNSTGVGGGVYASPSGSVASSFTNAMIDSNSVEVDGATSETLEGGGIAIVGSGAVQITGSTVGMNSIHATIAGSPSIFSGPQGAGIYVQTASLDLETSVVSGNALSSNGNNVFMYGGGLCLRDVTELEIDESSISDNTVSCTATSACRVFGGGIDLTADDSNTLKIALSTISDNVITTTAPTSEATGGALEFTPGLETSGTYTLAIYDSTISGNTSQATMSGGYPIAGGIFGTVYATTDQLKLLLNSTTITQNAVAGDSSDGGGLVLFPCDDSDAHNCAITATLSNTILSGNTGPDSDCLIVPDVGTATVISAGFNIIGSASTCMIASGTGDQVGATPMLGPLADNGGPTFTHALLTGSPAINAGNISGCADPTGGTLQVDQRGMPRAAGGRCDIGAFEAQ